MKLSLESNSDINEIISYDDNHVVIRSRNNPEVLRFEDSLLLTPNEIIQKKTISDTVTSDELSYLKTLAPEIVILTKVSSDYLHPKTLVKFTEQSIGVESMLLGAACRTYNLLAAEGRQVVFVIKLN